MLRVLIAIPTFENILPDTFKSIYGLEIPEGVSCQFDFIKGYTCDKARNDIVKEAIKYNFDYVFMVDSDILLPSHALSSMLENAVDICLGIYPRKNTSTGQTEVFKLNQPNFVEVYSIEELEKMTGKVKIKGGGMGCALIRTEVFSTLAFPWFKYVLYDNGYTLSEDNFFCDLAANKGFDIYVDTNVNCGHSIRGFQWR